MKQAEFLDLLKKEAKKQSVLETHRLLPTSLDPITAFIGEYSWQTILVLSFLSAFLWENWR